MSDGLVAGLALAVAAVLCVAGLWLLRRPRRALPVAAPAAPGVPGGDGELDGLLQAAATRLRTAGEARRLADWPVLVVLGDGNAAKTNQVIHAGVELELLAGQVYHGDAVVPTRSVNLWRAGAGLVAEVGSPLLRDDGRWPRLVAGLAPARQEQARRAALVCFDAERLLRPGAAETAVAMGQFLRDRVASLGAAWGPFPVYVLFTKADRIPCFAEFVSLLEPEQTKEILGATLRAPAPGGPVAGTEPVTAAFDRLCLALADRRTDLLARESHRERAGRAYEFPREMRKLRGAVAGLLAHWSAPPGNGPFLRGFYFSGVRSAAAGDWLLATEHTTPLSSSATSLFEAASTPPTTATGQPRELRVPQRLFLRSLFRDVLLADPLGVGEQTARVSSGR